MYTISVPVMIGTSQFDKKKVLHELKRAKADRVFLTLRRTFINGRINTQNNIDNLTELIKFFNNEGISACVWVGESIGHNEGKNTDIMYQCNVDIHGNRIEKIICPIDTNFVDDMCEWMQNIAKTNPEIILIDDDFRLRCSEHGPGCLCDAHIEEYNTLIDENLTRDEIVEKAFAPKRSMYRDAWRKSQGKGMNRLAKAMRDAVDEINPNIRIGLCTSSPSLDGEESGHIELAKVFAGKNKPLIRMLGAPYWVSSYQGLGTMITLERWLAYTVENEDIEVISEGDTYPRPRYACPASYLEIFDMALRADGRFDGILKYMLDYTASAYYEREYITQTVENQSLYAQIESMFSGKIDAGVNVIEYKNLARDMEYEGRTAEERIYSMLRIATARGSWAFLDNLSVPIAFGSDSAGIVFGESARWVPEDVLKKNGTIIDIKAAHLLEERGIDTGLLSSDLVDTGRRGWSGVSEYYRYENENVYLTGKGIFDIKTSDKAIPITDFVFGDRTTVASYHYENAVGMRFLVLAFDGMHTHPLGFSQSYARQSSLRRSIEWLQKRPVDVYCPGHPGLYILCKKNESSMAVGVWNIFPDKINEPELILGEKFLYIKCMNCVGTIDSNIVKISKLEPYACAVFEVFK